MDCWWLLAEAADDRDVSVASDPTASGVEASVTRVVDVVVVGVVNLDPAEEEASNVAEVVTSEMIVPPEGTVSVEAVEAVEAIEAG